MRQSIWNDLLKLIGIFGAIWLVSYAIARYWPDAWSPNTSELSDEVSLSIEQEEMLGELIMESFTENASDAENTLADSALMIITDRLQNAVPDSEYDYNFYLINSEMVNALTFPGGNIVVFTGLMEVCDSAEQLAAVLAHEMAHVEKRHVVKKLGTEIGIGLLISVVSGGDATIIQELSHFVLSSYFSRTYEIEADEFGRDLLVAANIHPSSMEGFFEKLDASQQSYGEELEWLMTHPANESRIAEGVKYELPSYFEAESIDLDWPLIKASL